MQAGSSRMSPGCHQDATRMRPGRHYNAAATLPRCRHDAASMPPRCRRDAAVPPPRCRRVAAAMAPGCHQDVARSCQDVASMSSGDAGGHQNVYRKSPQRSSGRRWMPVVALEGDACGCLRMCRWPQGNRWPRMRGMSTEERMSTGKK